VPEEIFKCIRPNEKPRTPKASSNTTRRRISQPLSHFKLLKNARQHIGTEIPPFSLAGLSARTRAVGRSSASFGPLLWGKEEEEPGCEQTADSLTHTRAGYMANMRRSLSPKGLIQRLNRKLAGERKVVGKTLGKSRSQKRGKYYLLDHSARTTRDLSLRELESIARELGVLAQDENLSTSHSAPMEGVAPANTDR
jgi:hypothetical protein